MVSICRTSDSGIGDTEGVAFIRFFDGREPQIHEIWCLGYYGVTREIHPTAQIEVRTGNMGQFTTH